MPGIQLGEGIVADRLPNGRLELFGGEWSRGQSVAARALRPRGARFLA
ncbi:MAG: hypothetical protein WB611_07865 [Stellaceae bacterium]